MIKIVTAAANPLQRAFTAVADNELSAYDVTVEYGARWVKIMVVDVPDEAPATRPVDVLELFINAFKAEGWGYRVEYDGPATDLGSKVVGYTFNHPSTLTRDGSFLPAHRPALLRLEIPLPDRRVELGDSVITRYATQAKELVLDLLTEQKLREDDERRSQVRPTPLWARFDTNEDADQ